VLGHYRRMLGQTYLGLMMVKQTVLLRVLCLGYSKEISLEHVSADREMMCEVIERIYHVSNRMCE